MIIMKLTEIVQSPTNPSSERTEHRKIENYLSSRLRGYDQIIVGQYFKFKSLEGEIDILALKKNDYNIIIGGTIYEIKCNHTENNRKKAIAQLNKEEKIYLTCTPKHTSIKFI